MNARTAHGPTPDAPGTEASGVVLVDKPAGWTSHDVVGRVRRLAGTRKVGHAGTLDPMATGLLVVGVNKATRLLTAITGTDKTYTATIRLGQSTLTDDAEGEVIATRLANAVTPERVAEQVAALTGTISQVPSAVSAVKVGGRRAYDRVRAGEDVQLAPREVTVHAFDVADLRRLDGGRTVDLDVTVRCTSGTYIRALARDLGEALDTGGHLTALRRTAVGPFDVADAVDLDALAERFVMTELSDAAAGLFPVRDLTAHEARELSFGRAIAPTSAASSGEDAPASSGRAPADLVAGRAPDGTVVALLQDGRRAGRDMARPHLVFAPSEGEGKGGAS
ncbi:tRNA pseudouridine(55) synthase TruB [Micrococcus sp.]|uniref:tRNA pseudouridine(55) synthase TruB n=1 Tax=Micrococcus sp. TaxID=1271 RepID=UPI0026DAC27C|nr:tRNA pseudouridine(55) synthase TruB [Micrococcus sp.]MDO4240659.1 tRNA pseudouridine(55) synthase TruB [Micrococcus sp.]